MSLGASQNSNDQRLNDQILKFSCLSDVRKKSKNFVVRGLIDSSHYVTSPIISSRNFFADYELTGAYLKLNIEFNLNHKT